MAWRILQFGALFAIGCTLESNSDSAFGSAAFETPNIDISLKLTDPRNVIVKKENSALLKCQAESRKGRVQLSWFHNEEKISTGSNWIIRGNGDLFIPKVAENTEENVLGEYRCLARNGAGALLSNVAELKLASMEKEFSINPVNSTIYLSQPTILRCGIQSTPPVDIQWEFNNNPILPHQTSYVPLPDGVLLIQNSQSSDNGAFRCKATNYILNEIKYSKIAYVTVLPELPEAAEPSILPLDISPNVTLLAGEKLTLYCAVMGWPIPTVQWLNEHNIVIGNGSVLEVPDVKQGDAGAYTCTAYNALGAVRRRHDVVVLRAPVFAVKPTSKSYPAAITARLDCRADGTPKPRVYWLKNGGLLKFNSRVWNHTNGVYLRNSVTNDSGIYQCVAENAVGTVWTAVQIDIINISQTPQPPQNLKCRPYNSSTICLNWKPPINVSVTGYSIHSFYNNSDGEEIEGFDYATNVTAKDADGLVDNKTYSFYVRLYSTAASDPSERVTCKTGVTGDRNLTVEKRNATAVVLKWSEISTDVSCAGEKYPYKVQWKTDWQIQTASMRKRLFVLNLTPGVEYNFRVFSTNKDGRDPIAWTSYLIPDSSNNSSTSEFDNNATIEAKPRPPVGLNAVAVSPFVVKLNWVNTDKNAKYFTACCRVDGDQGTCDDGKYSYWNSTGNKIRIKKLKPSTMYECRVRAHNADGVPGLFSKPAYAFTLADVPPAVGDLKYKIINASAVILYWRRPKETKANKIRKYEIFYSSDLNKPLERWPNVTVYPDDSTEESAVLAQLNVTARYTIFLRAVSDVGFGKPATLNVTTKIAPEAEISPSDAAYNQKVGFIVGSIIAVFCIICCAACILERRKCVKRRALAASSGSANSSDYYPPVARYAPQAGAVQVRLDQREQETRLLDVPQLTAVVRNADHLDTKGGEEFPNGHTNGTAKPYMNGHVHITENPQYYAFDCDKLSSMRFDEDSNSNVKPSKFYDLHELFEKSKRSKAGGRRRCDPHLAGHDDDLRGSSCDEAHSEESSLNDTRSTRLDETLGDVNRRVSPVLGPNG
ncbi:unnamed protein product [Phyllotreta striolata]|uniref:Uncharacterized protein n=1 Tax=Phyllotreta striolata TaxID=444603 RepID=A0A9N9TJ98_PHYSR|nr:unnamed protein product [Phyllotreta striolata]